MEESNCPRRRRWKARVGYGEGFLETRSLGSSIRGNIMIDGREASDCANRLDSMQ